MIAYVAMGSNVDDRIEFMCGADLLLGSDRRVSEFRRTRFEETEPLGGMDQPPYLNAMARFRWNGTAHELLACLHRLEEKAGRTREEHWGPRTLDLDLVTFGDLLCDTHDLRLPHPGLRDRMFWMTEMAELESNV